MFLKNLTMKVLEVMSMRGLQHMLDKLVVYQYGL